MGRKKIQISRITDERNRQVGIVTSSWARNKGTGKLVKQ